MDVVTKHVNLKVVEAGLGHLPFTEKAVITPTGRPYIGVDFAKKLCGVSIIRSGEAFENALRACCKGIKIGKILIHRSAPILNPALAKLLWVHFGPVNHVTPLMYLHLLRNSAA